MVFVTGPPHGIRRATGVLAPFALPQIVRVAGPALYVAGGIPVDLSAFFREILAVQPARAFATAGGAAALGVGIMPAEAGADQYAAARFRVVLLQAAGGATDAVSAGTPAGLNSAPIFTGAAMATHNHGATTDANVLKATGAVANVAGDDVTGTTTEPTALRGATSGSCIVGCDVDHPTGATQFAAVTFVNVTARPDLVQAPGASKVAAVVTVPAVSAGTPAGTVAAPVFAGDALAPHSHTAGASALAELANGSAEPDGKTYEVIVWGVPY